MSIRYIILTLRKGNVNNNPIEERRLGAYRVVAAGVLAARAESADRR